MAIELNRFLVLTLALATGAACLSGCKSTDDDDDNGQAGSGNGQAGGGNGQAGSSDAQAGSGNAQAGSGNEQAGSGNEQAGSGNEQAGSGNEQAGSTATGGSSAQAGSTATGGSTQQQNGGAPSAGASPAAGAPQAGAPSEAGASSVGGAVNVGGAANAGAANAGAGGVGEACLGDDPAFELDCATGFPTQDCSDADPSYEGNRLVDGCESLRYGSWYWGSAVPGVQAAAAACMVQLAIDSCSEEVDDAVAACKAEAAAKACENPIAVALCGTEDYTNEDDETVPGILASCPDVSAEGCVAALNPWVDPTNIAQCMNPDDPSGEMYDASFEGTCRERFTVCSKL
jgi:hypothetical protein